MTDRTGKFLIFTLQGALYAFDLAQVAEVGDPPQLYPIPLAPPCYSGALNFHGDIVAVMDLALFLGRTGPGKPGKIVVLRQGVASLAFLVDTVVRIVSGEDVTFSPAPDDDFAAAIVSMVDGQAVQLDLDALVHGAETAMQRNRSI